MAYPGRGGRISHAPTALAIAIIVMVSLIVLEIVLYVFGTMVDETSTWYPFNTRDAQEIKDSMNLPLMAALLALTISLGLLAIYFVYKTVWGED